MSYGMGSAACAVRRSGWSGGRRVLGVDLDRFHHQVEFIGAVDFAKHTVELLGQQGLGFGEVIQTVEPVGIEVFHDEHRALAAFRAGEQGEMIGAEVKHGERSPKPENGLSCRPGRMRRKSERKSLSRPLRSADEELARRTPPVLGVIITERRLS